MEKTTHLILLFFAITSSQAQLVPASLDTDDASAPVGTYFSDIHHEMDKFVGTWLYNGGNTSLTIIIQKKHMVPDDQYFEDLLIGEYRYTVNGSEIVNTLPLLNDPSIVGRYHMISGRIIWPNNLYPPCNECTLNERRFNLNFHDPERNYLSVTVVLRYLLNSATPQMTATITADGGVMLPSKSAPTETRVPYGEYLMTKQ